MAKPLELYLQKVSQQSTLQEAHRNSERAGVTPSRLTADGRTLTPIAPALSFTALAELYLGSDNQPRTGLLTSTPGAGVSTLLSALTYAAAQRAVTDPRAPLPLRVPLDAAHTALDDVIAQGFWELGLTLQPTVLRELLAANTRPLLLLVDVASDWDAPAAAAALDTVTAALDAAYPQARWLTGLREDVLWHLPLHWQRYTCYRLNLVAQEDAAEQFLSRLDPIVQAGMRQLFLQVPAMRELVRRPAFAQTLSDLTRTLPDSTPRTILVYFLRAMMTAAHAKTLPGELSSEVRETFSALLNAGAHGLRRSGKNAHLLPALRKAGMVTQLPDSKGAFRLADDSWVNVLAALDAPAASAAPPVTAYPAWQNALAVQSAADLETLNNLEQQIILAQAEVYHRRALAFRDEARVREALAQIRAALDIAHERADFQVTHGTIAVVAGDWEEGRTLLEESLPYAPTGDGYNFLARAYEGLGWQSEACQAYSRASEMDWHGQAEAAVAAARLASDAGRREALWQRALELDDQRPDWHFALGTLLAERGDLPAARSCYDAALRLNRTHGDANHALGMLLWKEGDTGAARQHLLVATANPPGSHDIATLRTHSAWLVDLGDLFVKSGDLKAAEESYSQAITCDPRNPQAYARKGKLLRRARRYEDAEYLLNESRLLDEQQGEVHFELGKLYEAQGRYADAVKVYRRAVQLEPTASIIHTHLGKAHRELGDRLEARHWLEKALDLDPMHSPALTEMAMLAETDGDFVLAARLYAQAVTAMPRNIQAGFRQGVMYLRLEQPADALPLLAAAAQVMRDRAEVQWYHGEALRRTGDGEGALSAYRRAIRLEPENLAYRFAFARHACDESRWEDARLALDIVLEAEPDNIEALKLLAELHLKKGAFNAALDTYRQALRLQPQDDALYLRIAGIHAQIGQLDEAIRALQDAVLLIGESADLMSRIAVLYEEQGMMESACEQLNFALDSDPAHAPSRLLRARLHTRLGHRKEAYHDWQTLLQYDPVCHEAHFGIGWLQESDALHADALTSYAQAIKADFPAEAWLVAHGRVSALVGQKELALQSLRRVIQRDSVSVAPQAHAEAHYLLAQLAEPATALAHLDRAVALEKHNAAFFLARAEVQDALGNRQAAFAELEKARTYAGADGSILASIARQYDVWGYNHEAIQSYIRAVEFLPDAPDLWVRLAVLQRGMEKPAEAREVLEEALRRRPDYAPAFRELGRTYEHIGDPDNALAAYRKSLALDPDDLLALERAAVLHLSANRFTDAEKLLKHALTLDSYTPAFYTLLGTLYAQSDRPAHALDIWQRASEQEPQNALYHRERGRAHLQMRQTDDARQSLTLAARINKGDAEIHYLLGQTWEAMGDHAQAAGAYTVAAESDAHEPRFRRALAELSIRREQWDEALHFLRAARDMDNEDPEIDYLMALCYEHMSGGSRLHQAVERAQQAAKRNPADPRYLRKLGDLYAKQGQWADAHHCYETLAPLQRGDRSLALALGESALHLSHYEAALDAFRHAVSLDPFDPAANRLLAESIARHFRPVLLAKLARAEFHIAADFTAMVNEGLEAAQRAYDYSGGEHASAEVLAHLYLLKEEPESAYALLQRSDPNLFGRGLFGELDGIVLLAVGESTRAMEAFRHAARAQPENPLLWLAYSVASNMEGRLDEALHFARDAQKFAPEEGIYLYALAHLTMLAGDERRAHKLMAQAVALRGDIPAWHRGLGYLATSVHKPEAAHAAFATALAVLARHTPDDLGEKGMIRHARAGLFQQAGDLDSAINELRGAIDCFPHDPSWYQELSLLLQNVGDFSAAETQLRTACRLAPDNPDLVLAMAQLLELSNKPAEALAELAAAATRWPQHVHIWCQYGRLLLDQKQSDAGYQAFQTALRLDPVEPLAHLGMAQYHAGRGQPESEREYILKAHDLAPENPDVLTAVGRLYLDKAGDDRELLESAARFFHDALKSDAQHLYAHSYLGELYRKTGQQELALQHFRAAADLSPLSGWVWAELADCYARQPNYQGAVHCYHNAMRCEPGNGEYPFALGGLHYQNHRYDDAISAYQKARSLKFRSDKCNIYIMQARARLTIGGK